MFCFGFFPCITETVEISFPTDSVGSSPDFDSHIPSTRLSPA